MAGTSWGTRQSTNKYHRFLAAGTFRRRQGWRDFKGWLSVIEQGKDAFETLFGGGTQPAIGAHSLKAFGQDVL